MEELANGKLKLRGRVGHFLILLIVIHFTYPFSEINVGTSAVYVVCYTLFIGYGSYITSQTSLQVRITGAMTVLTIFTGVIWAFTSNDALINGALYIFYVVIIANLAFIIQTFFRFIFLAKMVTRDVLFGGISLYLLIGNIFTPTYLLLNVLVKEFTGEFAFGVHTYDVAITWQRMYYLSFTVLTTLGFGDITPVSAFAEPFVLAEAGIGVLYVAILMARLVSLYESQRSGIV